MNDQAIVVVQLFAEVSMGDVLHGDCAEYAIQVPAYPQRVGKTYLEQRAHLGQYSSAATQAREQLTHTISLVPLLVGQ